MNIASDTCRNEALIPEVDHPDQDDSEKAISTQIQTQIQKQTKIQIPLRDANSCQMQNENQAAQTHLEVSCDDDAIATNQDYILFPCNTHSNAHSNSNTSSNCSNVNVDTSTKSIEKRGYIRVLTKNRNYRLYLLSHFSRHFGDWFVHVSNIIAVGLLLPKSSTALSILLATKLIPNILFPSLGGAIADCYDRRKAMMTLDLLGALVTSGHVLAIQKRSIFLLYAISFLRASLAAMYEPVTRSIVPLMVPLQDLKKCAVLNASAWSLMIVFGGTIAGYSTSLFGIKFCYVIDTFAYLLSLVSIWLVSGTYDTSPISTKTNFESAIDPTYYQTQTPSILPFMCCQNVCFQFTTMIHELKLYLRRCGFGICVFIKASATLSWGAATVLNYACAAQRGGGFKDDDDIFYRRIGYIYSSGGLGSLLGPIVVANVLELKDGKTFQLAIVVGFALQFCGWFGQAWCFTHFWVVCFFTALRTAGSSTLWVFSSLLFQTLVPADILGRVLAFELAAGFAAETIAVVLAGLSKDAGIKNQEVALGQGFVAFFFFSFWTLYYRINGGKANQILTQEHKRNARIDYYRYNHFV